MDGMSMLVTCPILFLGPLWLLCTAIRTLWPKSDLKGTWIVLTILLAPFLLIMATVVIVVWIQHGILAAKWP